MDAGDKSPGPSDRENGTANSADTPTPLTSTDLLVLCGKQAHLFDKLLKRLTRADLTAMLFTNAETEALLGLLGHIRAPLKGGTRPNAPAVTRNHVG